MKRNREHLETGRFPRPWMRSPTSAALLHLGEAAGLSSLLNRTICQDTLEAVRHLPDKFVDLLVLDPPYNLTKTFDQTEFKKRSSSQWRRLAGQVNRGSATFAQAHRFGLHLLGMEFVVGRVRRRQSTSSFVIGLPGNAKSDAVRFPIGRTAPRTSGSAPSRRTTPSMWTPSN